MQKPDVIWHPSPNFGERPEGQAPDMLVLHYTGMDTGAAALGRLCDPSSEVSAHYLVEEDGRIFQMVGDDKRAWHAGVSSWQGRSGLNDHSIGVEIVNPGHEFGYQAFPEAQMTAVEALGFYLVETYNISAARVVGHSDIAPLRKQDPGERFDWARLARRGVGMFPEPAASVPDFADPFVAFRDLLVATGYDGAAKASSLDDIKGYIIAFQRHWVPGTVTGQPCAKTTRMLVSVADVMKALKEKG